MVEYKCIRCGYIASQRINLRHHLNRKKICKSILEDISIESIKELYGFEIINNKQVKPVFEQVKPVFEQVYNNNYNYKKPGLEQEKPGLEQVEPGYEQINVKNKSKKKPPENKSEKTICIYCNKTFTRTYGLTCHLNICKEKKKTEELVLLENNKITEMENKIKELEEKNIKIVKKLKKQKHTNITNSNNTNTTNTNITNNIIIKNFGEENIEHLQDNIYEKLLQGIYTAVPKLIKLIHFDKNHPENQNIKFTNKKYPYLKIMKDNKWQLVNKNLEMRDLIDNKCYILNEKYYNILENQNELNDVQRSRIKQFMKKYNKDHKEVILDLINKTELILLNNS